MPYKQLSKHEWLWVEDESERHHAVRHFPQQGTLIWSSWVDSSQGPLFDEGVRQMLLDFAREGAPPGTHAPPDLLEAMRDALLPTPPTHPDAVEKRRWRILRRR